MTSIRNCCLGTLVFLTFSPNIVNSEINFSHDRLRGTVAYVGANQIIVIDQISQTTIEEMGDTVQIRLVDVTAPPNMLNIILAGRSVLCEIDGSDGYIYEARCSLAIFPPENESDALELQGRNSVAKYVNLLNISEGRN